MISSKQQQQKSAVINSNPNPNIVSTSGGIESTNMQSPIQQSDFKTSQNHEVEFDPDLAEPDSKQSEMLSKTEKLLKLQPNNANLQEVIFQINKLIERNTGKVEAATNLARAKLDEKVLGSYYERMVQVVGKEIGSREIKFKLDDPIFMQEVYTSPDGQYLKQNVESFIDKLEIICANLIKNQKATKANVSKVTKIEEGLAGYIPRTELSTVLLELEKRCGDKVMIMGSQCDDRTNELRDELIKTRQHIDEQVKAMESEVLWRIKDCEELIKERASKELVKSYINESEAKINGEIKSQCQQTEASIEHKQSKHFQTFFDQIDEVSRKTLALKTNQEGILQSLKSLNTKETFNSFEHAQLNFRHRIESDFEGVQGFCRELNTKITALMTNSGRRGPSVSGSLNQPGMPDDDFALFEAEIEEIKTKFGERLKNLDTETASLKETMQNDYVSLRELPNLMAEKVTRDELLTMIPDQQAIKAQLEDYMKSEIQESEDKLKNVMKSFDNRLVSFRKECDFDSLRSLIRSKAEATQVTSDLENHEFKIGTLDRNLVAIANDFQTFQKAINKMHLSLVELQECNKEVLLGKKKLNCLSCGQGKEKELNQVINKLGQDGRVYRATTAVTQMTQAFTDGSGEYQPSHCPTVNANKSPSNFYSRNMMMMSGRTEKTGNISGQMGMPAPVMPDLASPISGVPSVDSRPGTCVAKKQNPRLPFGYLVQAEKKDLMYKGVGNGQYQTFDKSHQQQINRLGAASLGRVRPDSAKVILGSTNRLPKGNYEETA